MSSQRGVTGLLERALGPMALRDDVGARLAGAVIAASLIALATMAVGHSFVFLSPTITYSYAIVLPLVALAPARGFAIVQAAAAVAIYALARHEDQLLPWQLAVLGGQSVLFAVLLCHAPLGRIGVRRALIAAVTIVMVPVYYWMENHTNTPTESFVGSARQFVLLAVLMASVPRDACTVVRNLALAFFTSVPLPIETRRGTDRRLVTMILGGLIFAAGLVILALYKHHLVPLRRVDWTASAPHVAGALVAYMLIMIVKIGAFGCLLVGNAMVLGVHVPAPIGWPHTFTNFAEAWRGTGVYMYRLAYDVYYRQFFPSAERSSLGTVLKVMGVFAVIGYEHLIWGGETATLTALVDWTVLGLVTGGTVIYLRHRSRKRLRAYVGQHERPTRSAWWPLTMPLCVAAVLAVRGLLEYALVDRAILDHLRVVLGI